MEAGYWKPVTGLSLGLGKILTLRLSPEDFPFCANKKTPIFFFIKHCNQGEARGGAFITSACARGAFKPPPGNLISHSFPGELIS